MNAEVYVGIVWVLLAVALFFLARRSCFDVPEGFYGLLYRHGESLHRISPGRHYFWTRGHSVRLVDMRKTTLNIGAQDLVSADHVPVKLSSVLTYQIIQAETAIHQVQDYQLHLCAAAQAELRALIALTAIDDLLDHRWNISFRLLSLVQPHADRIGIELHAVEVCEIVLPETSAATTRCGLFPVLPD
jgi:regulator of protease activity HflC (stomatin/prohibitin superfamily)